MSDGESREKKRKKHPLGMELRALQNRDDAERAQRFFKIGKGEYGEGDRFLGIRVPVLRVKARKYQEVSLEELDQLVRSPFHEIRLCAVLILVRKFERGTDEERGAVYRFYLSHTGFINNWDIVDCSAPHIVGGWLRGRSRKPLVTLAKSDSLWERRIAVIATFSFIKEGEFGETLRLAKTLMKDREDLIHKAVGWMLREVGNQDAGVAKEFLKANIRGMPRTMLRYAIERFPETERKMFLSGNV